MRKGRNRRTAVGSICLMSEYFHSLLLQGASQLRAKKSQKIRNFRSSEGSCILCLRTELCRVLSSSAWVCGRSSSPFLCILNVVGAYFNAFNQISPVPPLPPLNTQKAAGARFVESMLFLLQSGYVSIMIQKSSQSHCR